MRHMKSKISHKAGGGRLPLKNLVDDMPKEEAATSRKKASPSRISKAAIYEVERNRKKLDNLFTM